MDLQLVWRSCTSGMGQMAASCEHSYESWSSVKCVEIINYATHIGFSRRALLHIDN